MHRSGPSRRSDFSQSTGNSTNNLDATIRQYAKRAKALKNIKLVDKNYALENDLVESERRMTALIEQNRLLNDQLTAGKQVERVSQEAAEDRMEESEDPVAMRGGGIHSHVTRGTDGQESVTSRNEMIDKHLTVLAEEGSEKSNEDEEKEGAREGTTTNWSEGLEAKGYESIKGVNDNENKGDGGEEASADDENGNKEDGDNDKEEDDYDGAEDDKKDTKFAANKLSEEIERKPPPSAVRSRKMRTLINDSTGISDTGQKMLLSTRYFAASPISAIQVEKS